MALRNFKDSEGHEWRVWDVHPYSVRKDERRRAERRRGHDAGYVGPERRVGQERRRRTAGLLTPGLESGWLCFENQADKRRLTPIPNEWEGTSEDDLRALLEVARAVRRPV